MKTHRRCSRGAALAGRGGDVESAEREAKRIAGIGWTWDQLVDAYLADVKSRRAFDTWASYKTALTLEDLKPLRGKLLSLIEPDDIRKVRDSILRRGKERMARSCMQQIKAAMAWAVEQPDSGLKRSPATEVKIMMPGRTPTVEEARAALAQGYAGGHGIRTSRTGSLASICTSWTSFPGRSLRSPWPFSSSPRNDGAPSPQP